jgi:hypothetical protein
MIWYVMLNNTVGGLHVRVNVSYIYVIICTCFLDFFMVVGRLGVNCAQHLCGSIM